MYVYVAKIIGSQFKYLILLAVYLYVLYRQDIYGLMRFQLLFIIYFRFFVTFNSFYYIF
jgi:hypothetical protein